MARASVSNLPTADPREVVPSELAGKPVPDHDDLPVVETKSSVTGAGDGLSKAMKLADGLHLPIGAKVYVTLLCEVDSHEYDFTAEAKKSGDLDELVETAVLKATGGMYVDPASQRKVMAEHQKKVAQMLHDEAQARKIAAGEFPLSTDLGAGDGSTPTAGVDSDADSGDDAQD